MGGQSDPAARGPFLGSVQTRTLGYPEQPPRSQPRYDYPVPTTMIAVIAFGWGLLALPGLVRGHLSRLHPGLWTRLVVWSFGVGTGLILVGLVAMSAPTLLEGVGAHHLAALCRRLIHDLLAGGHVGGGLAAAFLSVLVVRALAGWRRLRRWRRAATIEPWVGDHRALDGFELVVVPTPELVALTAGAPRRQVVVSEGLVETLTEDELTMVVRHEVAHLGRRHHHHLAFAAIIEATLGWLPRVRSSVQALRLGVERWADEEAAGTDPGSRRILHSALLAVAGCHPQPGTAGFGGVDMAVERLRALEAAPSSESPRWLRLGAGMVGTAAASVWLTSVAVISISLTSGGICYL